MIYRAGYNPLGYLLLYLDKKRRSATDVMPTVVASDH